jgi:tetratricopeptide (TPR) repeat protein
VSAEREKLKGNEFYRVGEVEEAVKCYSRSIDLDPKNHILYANRAMGYLKLEAYEKAEEDCSKALAIDCTYVKAWSRRGLTRFKRGQYAAVTIQLFKLLYYRMSLLFHFLSLQSY